MDVRRALSGCERIVAKAPPLPHRRGCFSIDDFVIDTTHGVARCPAGNRLRRRDRVIQPHPGWRYGHPGVFSCSRWFGKVSSAQLTWKLGTVPDANDPDRVVLHPVEEAVRSDDDLAVR